MPTYINNPVLLLFFLLLSVFFFYSLIVKNLDRINYFFALSLVLIFYCLRGYGAPDFDVYYGYFKLSEYPELFHWPSGMYYLFRTISILGIDQFYYLIFSTTFILLLLSLCIFLFVPYGYRTSCLITFSMSWTFFDLVTNTYRQGIASLLLALVLYFWLIKKNRVFTVVLSILTLSFHWASIIPLAIVLIFPFFSKIKNRTLVIFVSLYFFVSWFIPIGFITLMNPVISFIVESTYGGPLAQARHYLQSDVEGAMFYSMGFFQRLYNIIDFIVAYIILVMFIIYSIIGGDKRNPLVNAIIALCFYFILFIDMVWFFRNMYWVFPILLLCLFRFVANNDLKLKAGSGLLVSIFYVSFFILYSTFTLWRTHLMGLHYDF